MILLLYGLGSIDVHSKITQAWFRDFYNWSREEHLGGERHRAQSSHPGLPA